MFHCSSLTTNSCSWFLALSRPLTLLSDLRNWDLLTYGNLREALCAANLSIYLHWTSGVEWVRTWLGVSLKRLDSGFLLVVTGPFMATTAPVRSTFDLQTSYRSVSATFDKTRRVSYAVSQLC